MTAAVVVAPFAVVDGPSSSELVSRGITAATLCPVDPAEARKRRREILASQRSLSPDPAPSSCASSTEHTLKKVKLCSDVTSSSVVTPVEVSSSTIATKVKGSKRPQMKYDPEIPMTKEEAAAWRREQRRKRNRESAAASRQRQRDRINELESEVDDLKKKLEEAQAQIQALEDFKAAKTAGNDSFEHAVSDNANAMHYRTQTPEPVESGFTCITPRASPVTCASLDPAGEYFKEKQGTFTSCGPEGYEEHSHAANLISRPAVKIDASPNATPSFPVLPDVAHSSAAELNIHFPEQSNAEDTLDDSALDLLLDPSLEADASLDDILPPLSDNTEDELETFLMDAMGII